MNRASLLLSLSVLLLPGCSRQVSGGPDSAGRPPVAVEAVRVEASDLEEAIDVVGSLAPRFEADVKAEYSGVVAEVHVTQWVRVAKGAPLARFDTREAEAQMAAARAALLSAEVGTRRGARELDRAVKLKEAGLATQQGLDEARTADEAARAALEAARAQLALAETRLAKSVVRAPMDGVVAARDVNVGDFVENMGNPPPMFRIVDNRILELTVSVPSTRLSALRVGQPLAFTTEAEPGRSFAGRVSFINPQADEMSRSVKVRAEVPNPEGTLKAGLFVKGRLVTGRRPGVLQVPRAALQGWDVSARTASVFLRDGETARRVSVATGAAAGDLVEVTSGLTSGQEVVTRGAFQLRDGDRLTVAAAAPARG